MNDRFSSSVLKYNVFGEALLIWVLLLLKLVIV
jgi:hypothetical protein